MKAIKALPLHWEATDGWHTYTPVIIIATDGKSEKCILSTTGIFDSILLRIGDEKALAKHNKMFGKVGKSYSEQVSQEFLDANYEIVERTDGIFEAVYNEKHYPLNERIRISYQSTPEEEAAAKAAAEEEELLQNEEVYLYDLSAASGLSPEEKESLEAKGKAFIDASRACLKALPELSHEEKERLEAERKAAHEDYREYLKPLREAEGIRETTYYCPPITLTKRLEEKAKVALEANRAYLKALLGLSHEEKERLKAEYKAAYEVYQEELKPLLEAEKKMIEAEAKAVDEATEAYEEFYRLTPKEEERLEAEAKAADEYLKTLPTPEDEI